MGEGRGFILRGERYKGDAFQSECNKGKQDIYNTLISSMYIRSKINE